MAVAGWAASQPHAASGRHRRQKTVVLVIQRRREWRRLPKLPPTLSPWAGDHRARIPMRAAHVPSERRECRRPARRAAPLSPRATKLPREVERDLAVQTAIRLTAGEPGARLEFGAKGGSIRRTILSVCVSLFEACPNKHNKLVLIFLTRHTLARAGLANRLLDRHEVVTIDGDVVTLGQATP